MAASELGVWVIFAIGGGLVAWAVSMLPQRTPVAPKGPPSLWRLVPIEAAPAGASAPEAFELVLTAGGSRPIEVIKVLRELGGFELKHAKALVDQPGVVLVYGSEAEAAAGRARLEAVGAAAAVRPMGGGGGARGRYEVRLEQAGADKIAAIKLVREVSGLGLKESKDLVDGAPGRVATLDAAGVARLREALAAGGARLAEG